MSVEIFTPESFSSHCALQTDSTLISINRLAWARFHQTRLPARTQEEWRFSTLGHNSLMGYTFAGPLSQMRSRQLVDASKLLEDCAASIVFVNGHLVAGTALPADLLTKGVVFNTLPHVAQISPELIRRDLPPTAEVLGGEKSYALHLAYLRAGYVLYIPDDVEISRPVVVYHWLGTQHGSVFPHTIVIAGARARANVVDFYLSSPNATSGLAISATGIHAGREANITHTMVQNWGLRVRSHHFEHVHLAQDATVAAFAFNLGAKRARLESIANLNGPGADARLFGLTVAGGEQEFDQRTRQVHNAPGARSDLLFKNALAGRARTIFSGIIHVAPMAQKTDAYQTNRNLILSSNAEAHSLPGLEIGANDVKCSHGATNSQVDPDELFYLRARGIPPPVAQELLVSGFFEEILSKLDEEPLQLVLRQLVQARFGSGETPA
ncbi:MAG: Fe-S cluster assembly protein SufD [Puniceicoccales bacterium]|jgi:Fe-S cluster assembly protein SufD|nr:Fe-S cluster assembly protein SufD [Puniceicoccales bacterium]